MPKYMKRKRTYRKKRRFSKKKRGISRALGINRVKYSTERLTLFNEIKSSGDGKVNLNFNCSWMQGGGIIASVNGFNNTPRWD